MDFITQSTSVIVLCLVIFSLAWIIRNSFETFWAKLLVKGTKLNKVWEELVLPTLPLVLGGVIGGFVEFYPYPEQFTGTTSRVFFGIFAGLISGLIYRLVKQNLLKKIKDIQEEK